MSTPTPDPWAPRPAPAAPAAPAWGPSSYGPPSPYGPASPYGPPPARTDDKAVWSLVSAIAGFVLLPIVLHIVGLVLANQSLRDIRAAQGRLAGQGMANAARILSIVGLALYGAAIVLGLLFLVIAVPLGLLTFGTVTSTVERNEVTVTPTSLSEIDGQQFQHDLGTITYDFSDLDFSERTVATSIDVSAGLLVVEVPDDVTVELDARVGAGELSVFGSTSDGLDVTRVQTFEGTTAGGTLELEVEMGAGDVTVERAG